MDITIVKIDKGSGKIYKKIDEGRSGDKNTFFQIECRHGETPNGTPSA